MYLDSEPRLSLSQLARQGNLVAPYLPLASSLILVKLRPPVHTLEEAGRASESTRSFTNGPGDRHRSCILIRIQLSIIYCTLAPPASNDHLGSTYSGPSRCTGSELWAGERPVRLQLNQPPTYPPPRGTYTPTLHVCLLCGVVRVHVMKRPVSRILGVESCLVASLLVNPRCWEDPTPWRTAGGWGAEGCMHGQGWGGGIHQAVGGGGTHQAIRPSDGVDGTHWLSAATTTIRPQAPSAPHYA